MSAAPSLVHLVSPDGRLAAWIAPDHGAELCGLEWEGRELLYRGRDFSATSGWTGRAPILWPAIGRTFASGSEPTAETFKDAPLGWTVDGVDYPMPMHGFARSLPWAIEDRTPATLRLVLRDSPQTRAFYPFGFRHVLTYALTDGLLTLRHEIEAAPGNSGPMPFVLGNHATFNLALEPGSDATKSTLVSNADRRMALDFAGRPTGATLSFDRFATPAPVSAIEAFDVLALCTTRTPPWAQLRYPSGLSVTVGHHVPERSLSAPEFVTLWGDPSGGYLSIEAWLGKPNALASGNQACHLAPGSVQRATIEIGIGEPNP